MRMRLLIVAALAWLGVGGGVSLLAAQGKKGAPPAAHPPPNRPNPKANNPNRPQPNPAKEVERFLNMPPEQREKELAKLPPARRARVEQQVERLNKLPPAQRARELQRAAEFEELPPQRRVAVRQQIQNLRALPRDERQAWLNSEEMKSRFSPAEQKLLRESFGQQELR